MAEPGIYEVIHTTRAVRRLRTDPIPNDVLRRILTAANCAPTGGNAQPWRVIAVQDPQKKASLQRLYSGPWQDYSRGHRVLLDRMPPEMRAQQERMLRAADHLANHLHQAPVILVFCFNPSLMAITDAKLTRPSIVGGASLYPAVQNTLLACRAEGLGCTLTTLLCMAENEVKSLLAIPDDWFTGAFVPIGYPVGKGHGPLTRRPVEKMSFRDTWGESLF